MQKAACDPDNLQNTYEKKLGMTDASYTAAVDGGTYTGFVRTAAGYGLAQWTYWSRKQGLFNFSKAAGRSIGDLEMQLDFLMKELREGYKAVLTTLKTVGSVRQASDAVLLQFERPADQSETAKKRRASFGQKYYDRYAKPKEGQAVGTFKPRLTDRRRATNITSPRRAEDGRTPSRESRRTRCATPFPTAWAMPMGDLMRSAVTGAANICGP